jgi:succinate dehydrogenase/fumarate reductase flavoprotein subunit
MSAHCQVSGERHPSKGADRKLRVVVVGGGPAGLLSALEAYKGGARVCVVEKRLAYTRSSLPSPAHTRAHLAAVYPES